LLFSLPLLWPPLASSPEGLFSSSGVAVLLSFGLGVGVDSALGVADGLWDWARFGNSVEIVNNSLAGSFVSVGRGRRTGCRWQLRRRHRHPVGAALRARSSQRDWSTAGLHCDHIALKSACCVVADFLALLAAARQQQGAHHDHRQQDGTHLTAGFLQKAWHNVLAGAVRRERG
jgi:hypothetical protein